MPVSKKDRQHFPDQENMSISLKLGVDCNKLEQK